MEITAKLAKVRLEKTPDSGSLSGFCVVAHGDIYEDKNGRFKDGTSVTTSRVKSFENGCLITQNSVYEVV